MSSQFRCLWFYLHCTQECVRTHSSCYSCVNVLLSLQAWEKGWVRKKLDGPKLKLAQIWASYLIYESWFPCPYQRSHACKDSLRTRCLNPWHSTKEAVRTNGNPAPFRDTEYPWELLRAEVVGSTFTTSTESTQKIMKSKDGEVVEGSSWWRR